MFYRDIEGCDVVEDLVEVEGDYDLGFSLILGFLGMIMFVVVVVVMIVRDRFLLVFDVLSSVI